MRKNRTRTATIPKKGRAMMSKRKKIILITAAVVFAVLGAWLLLSPQLNEQAALEKQDELLESIENAIEETTAPAETASPGESGEAAVTEPTPEAVTEPTPEAVTETAAESTENPITADATEPAYKPIADSEFPDGINGIGILTIEKINLRMPVAEGTDTAALNIAAGHVTQTAAIGETGNAVIAGHRKYDYGVMFNRLDEMESGDLIEYQAKSGETMRFEVFEIAEIYPENQIAFIQPKDESIITLYTCTPVRVATHRLLVRAKKI